MIQKGGQTLPVIDFHSHILPRADHGSDSVETSCKQVAMQLQSGTDLVVATPHFYPHRENADAFLARRAKTAKKLCQALSPEQAARIRVGAEVLICPGIAEMEGLELLTVAGTSIILLELPFTHIGQALIDSVLEVRERGLVPVLAHIDRYPPEPIAALLQQGIMAQLNASAFGGLFGGRRFMADVARGSVVALGSDLHGANRKEIAAFVRARRRLGRYQQEVFDRTAELLRGATPLPEFVEQPVPAVPNA